MEKIRLLYITANQQAALKQMFEAAPVAYAYDETIVDTLAAAQQRLITEPFEIIIADYQLKDGRAVDLGEIDQPLIVLLDAAEAVPELPSMAPEGVHYLLKDPVGQYLKLLPLTVTQALDHHRLAQELTQYKQSVDQELTTWRQIQQDLEVVKNKYFDLYHFSPIGYFTFDRQGRIIELNLTATDLLWQSQQMLLGESLLYYLDSSMQTIFLNHLQQVFDTKLPQTCDLTIQQPGGNKSEVQLKSIAFESEAEKGDFNRCHSAMIDITARKQAEQQLQESKQFLQAALDALMAHIAVLDETGTIIAVNAAWRDFATENDLKVPNYAIGKNYLRICETTTGPYAAEANLVADGIRAIIDNRQDKFYLEYDSSSPTEQRWFGVRVTRFRGESGPVRVVVAHEDVTERRVEEEQRRYQAKLLRNVFDAIIATDMDFTIRSWNRAAERIYGYPAEEVIGKSLSKVFSTTFLHQTEQEVIETFMAQGFWRDEVIQTCHNGRSLNVLSSVALLYDDAGQPNGMVSVNRDITEWKTTQQTLQLHDQALAASHNGITIIDAQHPDMPIIYANAAFEQITGYSIPEAIGRNPRFLHGDDATQPGLERLRNVIPDGEGCTVVLRNYRRDGRLFWNQLSVSPIYNDAGTLTHYIGIQVDITEFKKVEQQLRRSEEQLRAVLENMPVLVAAFDEAFNIIVWNGEAERVTGYQATEIIGNPEALTWLYPDPIYREQVFNQIKQALGNFRDLELTLTTKKNEERTIAWSDVSGQFPIPGWDSWAVGVDVTERRQAKEALELERTLLAQRVEERTQALQNANAELAHASRLKDEFLANMSHELRTPLNAILGMSEILREKMFGPLTERQAKYVTTIEESGRHLLALINDILDLSKIEAGKMELEITSLPVETICEASLRLVKQVAHKKRLKVIKEIDSQIVLVQGDERRLKQILVNLLSNAVKFTPPEGEIGLVVRGLPDQERVEFSVWDKGIGITKENIARLFKPFVQLDSRLARQYEGTGLGLSLVYRLVQMHGGDVTVVSEPNQGSRFIFWLPWRSTSPVVVAPEAVPMAEIIHQSHTGEDAKILLVEDNQANIDTLIDFLEHKGFQVTLAYNGLEAIERAKAIKPDLIFMDVQMPKMDGLTATSHIRQETDLADTPIIAMTALAMPQDRERCLQAGANDYLSKPIRLREVTNMINKWLKKQPGD